MELIAAADLSPVLRSLLLDRGSLTRRLMALSSAGFHVRVDNMRWSMPRIAEALATRESWRRLALVREVTLMDGDRPMVYARSIIPRTVLVGRYRRLANLGQRPLGELLFSDPGVRRGDTHLLRLSPNAPLYAAAEARTPIRLPELWGRYTLFYIHKRPLLVTEIFLDKFE